MTVKYKEFSLDIMQLQPCSLSHSTVQSLNPTCKNVKHKTHLMVDNDNQEPVLSPIICNKCFAADLQIM